MAQRSGVRRRAKSPRTVAEALEAYARRSLQESAATADRQIPSAAFCHDSLRLLLFLGAQCSLFAFTSELDAYFAKLIISAHVLELCGFGTMDGPLGNGNGMWTPLWFRTTPGTLKQPIMSWLGRRRTLLDVGLFLTYVLCVAHALLAADAALLTPRIRRVVCAHTLLCVLDRTAWTGGMSAYYYPLSVCLAWPGVGTPASIAAMQLVQIAHLVIPGAAKAGPWFFQVTPQMLGQCPLIPLRALRLCLFRDPDGASPDIRPNAVAIAFAVFGCMAETVAPLLWLGASPLVDAGLLLMVGMHVYLLLMFPIGSVLEWNAVNAFAEAYLFGGASALRWGHAATFELITRPLAASQSDAPLLAFLLWFELAGPILGLCLLPGTLSNHFSLRKYTGNHPYHIFLVRRSAMHKLNAVPSAARLETAGKSAEPGKSNSLAFAMRGRLNTKAMCDLVLRTCIAGRERTASRAPTRGQSAPADADGALDEYERLDAAHFLSQTLLDVSFVDAGLLSTLAAACGLEPGELLSLKILSFPIIPYRRPLLLDGLLPYPAVEGVSAPYRTGWRVWDACERAPCVRGELATDILGRRIVVCEEGKGAVHAVDGNGQGVALPRWATPKP